MHPKRLAESVCGQCKICPENAAFAALPSDGVLTKRAVEGRWVSTPIRAPGQEVLDYFADLHELIQTQRLGDESRDTQLHK